MPAPQTTHSLTFDDDTVTKTFRTWEREEHRREWRGLTLLADQLPGLAPRPVASALDAQPPHITMSRLPGRPLGDAPITAVQARALAEALQRLSDGVEPDRLADLPPRLWSPAEAVDAVRQQWSAATYDGGDPDVVRALARADTWISTTTIDTVTPERDRVFARADGNLGNCLWDGEVVRFVDFEDSGVSDRCFEIADTLEHPSAFVGDRLDPITLLEALDLDDAQRQRVTVFRRLFACFWLVRLLPGGAAARRNAPGTLEHHARRCLRTLWA